MISGSSLKVKVVGQRSPGQKCFRGVFGLMELDGSMGLHSDEDASSITIDTTLHYEWWGYDAGCFQSGCVLL